MEHNKDRLAIFQPDGLCARAGKVADWSVGKETTKSNFATCTIDQSATPRTPWRNLINFPFRFEKKNFSTSFLKQSIEIYLKELYRHAISTRATKKCREFFFFRFFVLLASSSSRSTSVVVRESTFLKHPRTWTFVEDDLGKIIQAVRGHSTRPVSAMMLVQSARPTGTFDRRQLARPFSLPPRSSRHRHDFSHLAVREPFHFFNLVFLNFFSLSPFSFPFSSLSQRKTVPRNIAGRRISSVVKRAARRLVVDY